MRRVIRISLILLLISALLPSSELRADPVGNFFKRLGDTLVNGPKRAQQRRAAKENAGRKKTSKSSANRSRSSPSPSPGEPEVSPGPEPTPTPELIRLATIAPRTGKPRGDLRYGVPVPNRPGLVRSPWAPNEGLVDVKEFAGGTAVVDPYTGKVFLTP